MNGDSVRIERILYDRTRGTWQNQESILYIHIGIRIALVFIEENKK
jgi:hypothetical protein